MIIIYLFRYLFIFAIYDSPGFKRIKNSRQQTTNKPDNGSNKAGTSTEVSQIKLKQKRKQRSAKV